VIHCLLERTPYRRKQPVLCVSCRGAIGFDVSANRRYCIECQGRSQRIQSSLRSAVKKAIVSGELADPKTLKCADCGAHATVYDHRDWTKPLQVEPVCNRHNLIRGPAANLMEHRLA
jgi:hypothetical protein